MDIYARRAAPSPNGWGGNSRPPSMPHSASMPHSPLPHSFHSASMPHSPLPHLAHSASMPHSALTPHSNIKYWTFNALQARVNFNVRSDSTAGGVVTDENAAVMRVYHTRTLKALRRRVAFLLDEELEALAQSIRRHACLPGASLAAADTQIMRAFRFIRRLHEFRLAKKAQISAQKQSNTGRTKPNTRKRRARFRERECSGPVTRSRSRNRANSE